jgi:hypothetical protein
MRVCLFVDRCDSAMSGRTDCAAVTTLDGLGRDKRARCGAHFIARNNVKTLIRYRPEPISVFWCYWLF